MSTLFKVECIDIGCITTSKNYGEVSVEDILETKFNEYFITEDIRGELHLERKMDLSDPRRYV